MERRTRQEIINNLVSNVVTLNPEATALVNLQQYSRLRDLLIANGMNIYQLEAVLEQIHKDIFIETASEEALEKKLVDQGMARGGATRSGVIVSIGTDSPPDRTIIIPANTVIGTSDRQPVNFRTIYSGQITTATPPTTAPDGKTYYTTDIQAESVDTGLDTNVNSMSINKFVTAIPGITVVYNDAPSTGGSNIESVAAMKNRLKITGASFDRGTLGWFISQIYQEFPHVQDVRPVRSPYGNGTISLYLAAVPPLNPTQQQEIYNYFMDPSRADAGGWGIEILNIATVGIDLNLRVYRSSHEVDFHAVESISYEYFNTMEIGQDFFNNRYIAYLIKNNSSIVDIDVINPIDQRTPIDDYQVGSLNSVTVEEFVDTTLRSL